MVQITMLPKRFKFRDWCQSIALQSDHCLLLCRSDGDGRYHLVYVIRHEDQRPTTSQDQDQVIDLRNNLTNYCQQLDTQKLKTHTTTTYTYLAYQTAHFDSIKITHINSSSNFICFFLCKGIFSLLLVQMGNI